MSEPTAAGKSWAERHLPLIAATALATGLGPGGLVVPWIAGADPATPGQSIAAIAAARREPASPVASAAGFDEGASAPAGDARSAEIGTASWYGPGFHGRLTASGETYDAAARTVAHRTLPLGTVVRIENLANGREAVARVNDRGPYVGGRIIDCSYAVARALRFARSGVARVRVTPLDSLGRAGDFEPARKVRLPWVRTPSSFLSALDEPLMEDVAVAPAPAMALATRAVEEVAAPAAAPAEAAVRQASVVPYPAILHAGRHAAAWLSDNRVPLTIPLDLRTRLEQFQLGDVVRRFIA